MRAVTINCEFSLPRLNVEGLITEKFHTRFRNLGISLKISGFPERFQDFMEISRFQDFQISMKISARFLDSSADFDILILNFRM